MQSKRGSCKRCGTCINNFSVFYIDSPCRYGLLSLNVKPCPFHVHSFSMPSFQTLIIAKTEYLWPAFEKLPVNDIYVLFYLLFSLEPKGCPCASPACHTFYDAENPDASCKSVHDATLKIMDMLRKVDVPRFRGCICCRAPFVKKKFHEEEPIFPCGHWQRDVDNTHCRRIYFPFLAKAINVLPYLPDDCRDFMQIPRVDWKALTEEDTLEVVKWLQSYDSAKENICNLHLLCLFRHFVLGHPQYTIHDSAHLVEVKTWRRSLCNVPFDFVPSTSLSAKRHRSTLTKLYEEHGYSIVFHTPTTPTAKTTAAPSTAKSHSTPTPSAPPASRNPSRASVTPTEVVDVDSSPSPIKRATASQASTANHDVTERLKELEREHYRSAPKRTRLEDFTSCPPRKKAKTFTRSEPSDATLGNGSTPVVVQHFHFHGLDGATLSQSLREIVSPLASSSQQGAARFSRRINPISDLYASSPTKDDDYHL